MPPESEADTPQCSEVLICHINASQTFLSRKGVGFRYQPSLPIYSNPKSHFQPLQWATIGVFRYSWRGSGGWVTARCVTLCNSSSSLPTSTYHSSGTPPHLYRSPGSLMSSGLNIHWFRANYGMIKYNWFWCFKITLIISCFDICIIYF